MAYSVSPFDIYKLTSTAEYKYERHLNLSKHQSLFFCLPNSLCRLLSIITLALSKVIVLQIQIVPECFRYFHPFSFLNLICITLLSTNFYYFLTHCHAKLTSRSTFTRHFTVFETFLLSTFRFSYAFNRDFQLFPVPFILQNSTYNTTLFI